MLNKIINVKLLEQSLAYTLLLFSALLSWYSAKSLNSGCHNKEEAVERFQLKSRVQRDKQDTGLIQIYSTNYTLNQIT